MRHRWSAFVRWSEKGIFARIFEELAKPSDTSQEVLTIDATHLKAHSTGVIVKCS